MPICKQEVVLQGIGASPGIAIGTAFTSLYKEVEIPGGSITADQVEAEVLRFKQAILQTRDQINELSERIAEQLGKAEAQIFDAHLLILEDQTIIDATISQCRKQHCNIAHAFHLVPKRYINDFSSIHNTYFRERVGDIRDITRRVLSNLMGSKTNSQQSPFLPDKIIISDDLSPSDAANLPGQKVIAIVTNTGSYTSHTAIIARSLNVPAVVGVHPALGRINEGDTLLVDGYEGKIILHPSAITLSRYKKLDNQKKQRREIFQKELPLPTETLDGKPILLTANIENPNDARNLSKPNTGVGLFRTEFLFLKNSCFPDEEEQYLIYRSLAEYTQPGSVVIRTLDLGSDKHINGVAFSSRENNPALGFRAIRLCLQHKAFFKKQLRAILRASAHGNIKVLYPMVTSVEEIIQANALLEEAKEELKAQGKPYQEAIEVGSMIEVPAAALTAELIASHCAFLSIGTNDLIQYTLAVDRNNERVSSFYEPNHLAVLRLIEQTVKAAHNHPIPTYVCGEMARDPLYVPFLLGIGMDGLSVSAASIPEVKYLIRHLKIAEAEDLAKRVLASPNNHSALGELKAFSNPLVSSRSR